MRKFLIFCVFALILTLVFPPKNAHADVAPPETPPGSNIVPGTDTTQVRMVSETVILTVSGDPSKAGKASAHTEVKFTMRNLGSAEEKMRARFPLSFFNGNSNGFGIFPEINEIAVKVNGTRVSTQREMQPFFNTEGTSYQERSEIPWAVFDVTFPPAQDVSLEVSYDVEGYGYYPYQLFKYVLETGAGWKDSIGSVDVIVRLPYPANSRTVWMQGGEFSGYGSPTQNGVFSGNEIRWHFDNLEPTWEDNIQVLLIAPNVWRSIMRETDTVTKNPNDGEAWGRLGMDYKQIVTQKHGELRTDPAGLEMYELSKSAYEKCLALLPNDSLWHYGYAELLWSKYYYEIYFGSLPDTDGMLPRILTELKTALDIDPNNEQAKNLLSWIEGSVPGAVESNENNFIFLGLTATPPPPTPYGGEATPTLIPTLTSTSIPPTLEATTSTVTTPESALPVAKNPICGSAAIFPVLFGLILVLKRKPTTGF